MFAIKNNKVERRYSISVIAFCLFFISTLAASAQQLSFGFFSYEQALNSMKDYVTVQQNMKKLQAQYDAEAQRMADEFNNKYEEFLEVQRTLAPAILNKRQAELQALANRGETFKEEAKQHLAAAKEEAMRPVLQRLDDAIKAFGKDKGYDFIINTDNNALPYVDTSKGEDITEMLIAILNSRHQR